MRISTSWSYQSSVNTMITQQSDLHDTQMKISTGKKYLTPAENPVVASSLLDLNQNIQENQQYQVNIGAAQEKLQAESSSLKSATSIVQSIRDLTVQGLNSINTAQNRQQIAIQIDQLNQQLLTVANTQGANGEYIFSGTVSNTQAYTSSGPPANTFTYNGDANQRNIIIGPADRQVAEGDPGSTVFGAISAAPLTAGSISNVLQAVNQISADLKANTPNAASLTDLDNALTNMDTMQASAGARLQALTSQQNINDQTILDNKTTSSAIGDLDYASAISQFTLQQTALQAAQQAFTKVKSLSMFQYL